MTARDPAIAIGAWILAIAILLIGGAAFAGWHKPGPAPVLRYCMATSIRVDEDTGEIVGVQHFFEPCRNMEREAST